MSLKRDIAYKLRSTAPIPIMRSYDGLPILGRMAVKPDTYKERHAHSTAWVASIVDGKLSYRKLQNPGQTTVKPVTPSWYNTVRTDTTDKLQRNKLSVKTSKSY